MALPSGNAGKYKFLTGKGFLLEEGILLVSVIHDVKTYAKELNDDLKKGFNPDPSKQAQEVVFSPKWKRPTHPYLVFNNNNVSQTFYQNQITTINSNKATITKSSEYKTKITLIMPAENSRVDAKFVVPLKNWVILGDLLIWLWLTEK